MPTRSGYCTVDENPVGDHDLLEGDKAEVIKFTLVMFQYGDAFIPTATLRPETIHGVTNLWANPDVTYVRALVDGTAWIVSKEAAEKLVLQDHTVEVKEEIPGKDLVDKTVSHPLCGTVPILPADFVDPDMATGMVMSVPAHAPFDYIALRDLQQQGKYTQIKPIPLIKVEGYGEVPAQDAVERAGIRHQMDSRMDALTQEIYSAEFSKGTLFAKYGGKPVRVAREEVAQEMCDKYHSVVMYEFDTRPVICRCGNKVKVKILHDQWFLKYSDPEVEGAGQRPLEGHGARPTRGPHRVRPDGRLAQGLGLHPPCRPWHPVPVGPGPADRTALRLDGLHGILHDRPQDP